jgi:hypothetical protein
MRKDFFKNILAVFIGLAIAFMVTEITLRIWQPIHFRVKGNKIILPVNQKLVINNNEINKLDRIIFVSRNCLGFRGNNPPEKFADYLTIITVGGSTTECRYLSENKTWTDDLEIMFQKDFKEIWINNAGIDGNSTFGHIVLLEDHIIKLKPKVVIFLVGINDIGLADYNIFDDRIIINRRYAKADIHYYRILLNKSETYYFILNLCRYWQGLKMNVQHKKNFDLSTVKDINVTDAKISELLQLHKGIYLKGYQDRLLKIIEICKDNNIIPVFITQPGLYGEGIDDITGKNLETMQYGDNLNGKAAWKLLEFYNDTLRQVSSSHGILLIDLAREMPKSYKYYYDVHHYTNEGSQKVAEIIYQKLYPFMATKFKEHKIGTEP